MSDEMRWKLRTFRFPSFAFAFLLENPSIRFSLVLAVVSRFFDDYVVEEDVVKEVAPHTVSSFYVVFVPDGSLRL